MTLKSRILTLNNWLNNTKTGAAVTTVIILAMGVVIGVIGTTVIDNPAAPQTPHRAPAAPLDDPVDTFMPAMGDTDAVLSLQVVEEGKNVYHRCTATLITTQTPAPDRSEWAATAAHCVTPPPKDVKDDHTTKPHCDDPAPNPDTTNNFETVDVEDTTFTIRGGTSLYATGGLTATVTEIHVAPRWKWRAPAPGKPSDDLALLRFDRPLNIAPVPVATVAPQAKDWVLVDGWSTRPDRCGDIKPRMEQWSLKVDPCQNQTIFEVCASTHQYADAPCEGVSGGPLFTITNNKVNTIAGVYSVAYHPDCLGQTDMSFTSLAQYSDFITTTMAGTG